MMLYHWVPSDFGSLLWPGQGNVKYLVREVVNMIHLLLMKICACAAIPVDLPMHSWALDSAKRSLVMSFWIFNEKHPKPLSQQKNFHQNSARKSVLPRLSLWSSIEMNWRFALGNFLRIIRFLLTLMHMCTVILLSYFYKITVIFNRMLQYTSLNLYNKCL